MRKPELFLGRIRALHTNRYQKTAASPEWTRENGRVYDKCTSGGSFLSIDPVTVDSNSGESFNRYAYVNNSLTLLSTLMVVTPLLRLGQTRTV